MQQYDRYRRKTGLVTDGLDPTLLTHKRHVANRPLDHLRIAGWVDAV